jgi:hypothetical protein
MTFSRWTREAPIHAIVDNDATFPRSSTCRHTLPYELGSADDRVRESPFGLFALAQPFEVYAAIDRLLPKREPALLLPQQIIFEPERSYSLFDNPPSLTATGCGQDLKARSVVGIDTLGLPKPMR